MSPWPILRRWTPEEDELLTALVSAGKRPALIAAKLKRTKSAVLARASQRRLSFGRRAAKRDG